MLDRIVAHKRTELAAALPSRPRRRLRPHHSLRAALARPGVRLILECKRASPSAGVLRPDRSLAPVLAAYAGIADAVSVLTDHAFFGGSLDDLDFVASRVAVPVLCKDFIIDPRQVREAGARGADAVLLMLSVLDDDGFKSCAREARRGGMEVLAEVHDGAELDRALTLEAPLIGINNRSFADLSVDLDVTRRLAPHVPPDRIVICESGIDGHADLRRLAPAVDAFLVGTALMRSRNIGLAARELAFGEVKICGLTRPEDARLAWTAGARWGGVVFAPDSPRRIEVHAARAIAGASPLQLVGVLTDASPSLVGTLARRVPLTAVQLHGDEDAATVAATRDALPPGCALWKAVRTAETVPALPHPVDRILFDGAAPGTGSRFDWSLLPPPLVMSRHGLAGGVAAGNVAAALATGAGLIDVSSGVESATGVKSAERLAALFDAIRLALQGGVEP